MGFDALQRVQQSGEGLFDRLAVQLVTRGEAEILGGPGCVRRGRLQVRVGTDEPGRVRAHMCGMLRSA